MRLSCRLSRCGVPVLDATLDLEPTGNNNNNIGLGLGNTAATVLGNNNNNVAAGLVNQAITVGTPGIDLLAKPARRGCCDGDGQPNG